MLHISSRGPRVCQSVSRRSLLQAGGAGLFGLTLPGLLRAEANSAAVDSPGRAKRVLFLFMFGGPSQLETFDLKPHAPDKIRGPYMPIASRTPGLLISEKLPRLAAMSDKFSIVRTISHEYNDHSGGAHYMQTGHRWPIAPGGGFNATPQDWPSFGSVCDYVDEQAGRPIADVPRYAVLPNSLGYIQTYSSRLVRPGEYAGWLGRGFDPITTVVDKRDAKDNPYFRPCVDDELTYELGGLVSPEAITLDRLSRRRSLLEQFDEQRRAADRPTLSAYDQFQQRALALVTSERTRLALDVRQEPAEVRDRYGRNLFGQSVLVARRLLEAGSRFVTVHWDAPDGYSWDSHINSKDVGDHLLPGMDQTVSAVLEDLEQRGLLDETLVICVGEMGRTPLANANWGRNHWSTLFPALLAGGGIAKGGLVGASDRNAEYAVSPPFSPDDMGATIFQALGINPEHRVNDRQNRPVPISEGEPIRELFA